jgi:hypothetical protein
MLKGFLFLCKYHLRLYHYNTIEKMNRIYPDSNLIRPRLRIVKEDFPKPKLVRQTNEHEHLPHDLLLRWWVSNAEEKKNIWLEYNATTD